MTFTVHVGPMYPIPLQFKSCFLGGQPVLSREHGKDPIYICQSVEPVVSKYFFCLVTHVIDVLQVDVKTKKTSPILKVPGPLKVDVRQKDDNRLKVTDGKNVRSSKSPTLPPRMWQWEGEGQIKPIYQGVSDIHDI